MLVLDSNAQVSWQQAATAQANAALRQQTLLQDIQSNSISVQDDAGHDVSNLLVQMGRPLHAAEIQRRLQRINPNLIFIRSTGDPTKVGIYIERNSRNAAGGWEKRKVHICGMESGISPEFSVIHKGKKKVANPELFGNKAPTRDVDWAQVDTAIGETRGWRTVLVRLLHAGIISQGDVERHFAWVPSRESRKWAEFTR